MTFLTEFEVKCKATLAKAKIQKVADASDNFADFEYDVYHDKDIMSILPKKYIKIIVQGYAHILD